MRKVIIAGNWKMNKTVPESIDLANSIKRSLYDIAEIEIVICPPFTSLSDVFEMVMDSNIILGGQDAHWEAQGAFTGEISCGMLKGAGCRYVIIGHSERRQFFGETNKTVNLKAKAVLKAGLRPIVCVGEKLEERRSGQTFGVVKDHVENSLAGLTDEDMLNVVIAYEPVWAIGTGVNATKEQAQDVHKYIRELIKKLHGEEVAGSVRIQYGGSVKADNIKELISQEDVDGALVGGSSLNAESFCAIVRNCLK